MTATMTIADNRMADSKINLFFAISLGLHMVLLAGMVYGAFRNPHPNFKFDVMQVQLMSAGQLPPAGDPNSKNMTMQPPKPAPSTPAPVPDKKQKPNLPADATKEDLPKKGAWTPRSRTRTARKWTALFPRSPGRSGTASRRA